MQPIDTIIFDYGGVVADHYQEPYQTQMAQKLGTDIAGAKKLVSEKEQHGADYRLNKITKEQFWNKIKELSKTEFNHEEVHQLWVNTYQINVQMVEFLKKLKQKGLQIGMALNEDKDRWEYIKSTYHVDDFSSINILSFEIGLLKPHKEFYNEVLKQAHRIQNPERVLYVDDRQTHIDGAKYVGMQGYVFTTIDAFKTFLSSVHLVPFA